MKRCAYPECNKVITKHPWSRSKYCDITCCRKAQDAKRREKSPVTHTHCAYCAKPLPPNCHSQYCNDRCRSRSRIGSRGSGGADLPSAEIERKFQAAKERQNRERIAALWRAERGADSTSESFGRS